MASRSVRQDTVQIRRATNVSLNTQLVATARDLDLNLSRACEEGLKAAIAAERAKRWHDENRDAIIASNTWVAERGLPLEKFRLF